MHQTDQRVISAPDDCVGNFTMVPPAPQADCLILLIQKRSNLCAHATERRRGIRNDTIQSVKQMGHTRMTGVVAGHAGCCQFLCIDHAFVAQWVEFGGMNKRSRQVAQIRGAKWRNPGVRRSHACRKTVSKVVFHECFAHQQTLTVQATGFSFGRKIHDRAKQQLVSGGPFSCLANLLANQNRERAAGRIAYYPNSIRIQAKIVSM